MKTKIKKGSTERNKTIAFLKWWKTQGNNPRDVIGNINDDEVNLGNEDYLILTDDEAEQKARDYIEKSVWAFNKSFLDSHSEAISNLDDKTFSYIQEKCESANETIKKMIDDFDYFVEDAIATDGRGHFISSYDGEEGEVNLNGEYFYIYRIN